jgi:RNA polymerase sigma-70 factor (ECF subfamily)
MASEGCKDGHAAIGAKLEPLRGELTGYLHRLLAHPQQAEDVAQDTFVRALAAASSAPADQPGYRRWVFRIATNLAIDAMRQRRRRQNSMQELRADAENDPVFVARSVELIGTPETATIAAEHLAACFACALSNLPAAKAAALLLTEVHGFSVAETADAVGVSFNQAKNAIQDARRVMTERYETTCALVTKQGVCHQCEELADFFGAEHVQLKRGDVWAARRRILQQLRSRSPGLWHTLLLGRGQQSPALTEQTPAESKMGT